MTVQIINHIPLEEYNNVSVHPLQTWQWGDARKQMGIEIVRFGAFESNLKQAYLMTIHQIPHTPYKIGYIPRSVIPSKEVMKSVEEIAKEQNIIFVKWEPNEERSLKTESIINQLQKQTNLKRSSHQLFPDWTMTLDLSPSEELLLKNMKSKTRYNIKLATKKGVTVEEHSDMEGFEIFQKLYFETTKRQRYHGHNRSYHEAVWQHMKEGIAHILIARYNGQPLAAYELFLLNDTLYYPYGGSSTAHKNVMAANLIMWEAIKFGKNHGATKFDMWGATNPQFSSDDPYAGFTRFKQGYNASFVQMIGSYDQVINQTAYAIYSALYRLRHWYLTWNA